MKFRGGYDIFLAGRPDGITETPPEPRVLYIPLWSGRFEFSELCVNDGESVRGGDVLARDPGNFSVPLLAPRAGVVRLQKAHRHIVLEDISKTDFAYSEQGGRAHIAEGIGEAGIKRYKLLELGAWQFFSDARTGLLPDPLGTPQAVIVSTVSLEPFVSRGDVQFRERLLDFSRGLERLQSLLEYQPMYLVMPDINSEFAEEVRRHIRGWAWAKLIEIPMKYPFDNPAILAGNLGLRAGGDSIWFVRTDGVLAVDCALTLSKPCLDRIISIGGPAAESPVHVKVMTGYPVEAIRSRCKSDVSYRIINGGVFTGETVDSETLGLDSECTGITVLAEHTEREFLGFMRPGRDRSSYAGCFLSSLRAKFSESFSTAMRGEPRPCVSCNFCEEVCPAGIMPYLLHKYLYGGLIEQVEQAGVDLCVECGLCSFVCPSKLDLRREFIEAKALIAKEKEEIRREQLEKERHRLAEEARRKAAKEAEY